MSSSSYDPPFKVPKALDVLSKRQLEHTALLKFYELNKSDFFAIMTVMYFEVMADPDPGALKDPVKGFNSFCDLMTEYFLAAPSDTLVSKKDDKGQDVNFFGEAIADHLQDSSSPIITSQQLYAYDGLQNHPQAWRLVNIFVQHVAIDSFKRALSSQEDFAIQKARICIKELQNGSRKLKFVPEAERTIFR
jgi:hypothetical protein